MGYLESLALTEYGSGRVPGMARPTVVLSVPSGSTHSSSRSRLYLLQCVDVLLLVRYPDRG